MPDPFIPDLPQPAQRKERRRAWSDRRAAPAGMQGLWTDSSWQRTFSAARAIRADLALVALILCLLWGGIVTWVEMGRKNLEMEGLRTASGIAGAAEQGVSRTIEAMDQRLRFAREVYRRDPAGFDLKSISDGAGFTDSVMMQLAFIDATGILRQTNLGPTENTPDLSDREHFRVQLERPDDFLFISVPVLGRVSHRWSVQFTRKVWKPNGSLAGVLVGSLDPYWMTQFQDMLDVNGKLLLLGDDGVVRAAAPRQNMIGMQIGTTPLGEAVRAGDHGSLLLPFRAEAAVGQQGGDFVSFRRLRNYALTIVICLDPEQIFAPFEQTRLAVLAMGVGLTVLVLAAGTLLARNRFRVLTSQESLRNAIENIDQGLVMLDGSGRLAVHNRRFTDLLRLPEAEMTRGLNLWERLGSGRAIQSGLHEETAPTGRLLEVRTHTVENGGLVRTYTDITERRKAEARISELAHYDALTGLANRTTLETAMRAAMESTRQGGTALAVLCLDLDRFKLVNDTLGHAAGDELLRQTAQRLTQTLGASGLVARMGGDEFVVLQTRLFEPAQAEETAARIVSAFRRPTQLAGRDLLIGVSIGVAVYSGGGQTVETLLKNADIALYVAKNTGRGKFRLFEAAMEAEVQARAELEQDLAQAFASQALCLHYQPIFGREPGVTVAYEALLRWRHPKRGWISPTTFIPVAEESVMILPLGRWILLQACAAAALWREPYGIAVNLSPMQVLDGNLPRVVADILAQTGLEPGRLTLEITEGVLLRDVASVQATLADVKALGVRLVLDDFGTGYSSLSYLSQFPFDALKIDQSFTQKLDTDPGALAIVQAILALSRSLNLRTTAEGVETSSQLSILRQLGCDQFQGYLLGEPTPLRDSGALEVSEAVSWAAGA